MQFGDLPLEKKKLKIVQVALYIQVKILNHV